MKIIGAYSMAIKHHNILFRFFFGLTRNGTAQVGFCTVRFFFSNFIKVFHGELKLGSVSAFSVASCFTQMTAVNLYQNVVDFFTYFYAYISIQHRSKVECSSREASYNL